MRAPCRDGTASEQPGEGAIFCKQAYKESCGKPWRAATALPVLAHSQQQKSSWWSFPSGDGKPGVRLQDWEVFYHLLVKQVLQVEWVRHPTSHLPVVPAVLCPDRKTDPAKIVM